MRNRGQVSETINWVVATIIIVIVVVVCFFIANSNVNSNMINFDFQLFPDKQQDFIITKSVTNFVSENFILIQKSVQNNNYLELDEKIDSFLKTLPVVSKSSWGWSFVLKNPENKNLFETGHTARYYRDVEFVFNEPDFKIIFGEQCKECQPMYNIAH